MRVMLRFDYLLMQKANQSVSRPLLKLNLACTHFNLKFNFSKLRKARAALTSISFLDIS
jgi:hypothetical protein